MHTKLTLNLVEVKALAQAENRARTIHFFLHLECGVRVYNVETEISTHRPNDRPANQPIDCCVLIVVAAVAFFCKCGEVNNVT